VAVYSWRVSVIGIVLLAAAVLLLATAEWPRLSRRFRHESQSAPRRRAGRPRHLRVVETDSDPEEFQRAVERDLANLPTYDPRAKRD
jgi:hypothetical protein